MRCGEVIWGDVRESETMSSEVMLFETCSQVFHYGYEMRIYGLVFFHKIYTFKKNAKLSFTNISVLPGWIFLWNKSFVEEYDSSKE